MAWWLENILSEITLQAFLSLVAAAPLSPPWGTVPHERAAVLTVIRDGKPWGFIMISGQIPVSQNGMSSWGTISPHTPAEEKTFKFTKQQTTSRADAHHQIFFSVFLLLSFSWITSYPDSLPWPVLPTCRLEESPCDRTGKISIPLHNFSSNLWISKLGKKALDSIFRSN